MYFKIKFKRFWHHWSWNTLLAAALRAGLCCRSRRVSWSWPIFARRRPTSSLTSRRFCIRRSRWETGPSSWNNSSTNNQLASFSSSSFQVGYSSWLCRAAIADSLFQDAGHASSEKCNIFYCFCIQGMRALKTATLFIVSSYRVCYRVALKTATISSSSCRHGCMATNENPGYLLLFGHVARMDP